MCVFFVLILLVRVCRQHVEEQWYGQEACVGRNESYRCVLPGAACASVVVLSRGLVQLEEERV